MTACSWEACSYPSAMLELLRGRASDRKMQLFGCACCRRVWQLIVSDWAQAVVETMEKHVEGRATHEQLVTAAAEEAEHTWAFDSDTRRANYAAEVLAAVTADPGTCQMVSRAAAYASGDEDERGIQVVLLHDIFGNPFRPVALDPSWRTSTVVALAEGVYADRAFDRLPILADALQDAGCGNEELLAHLRGDGPHVRGCWALDLILGKE